MSEDADNPRDARLLRLNAALDDELDAAHRLELDHEMAADAALRDDYRRLEATRQALRGAAAPREIAPATLKARLAALGAPAPKVVAMSRGSGRPASDWLAMAAAFAAGLVVAGGALTTLPRAGGGDASTTAIVADFARAAVSGQPIDVASSDRHTVKPWLANRVALGVAVVDLASDGFPLTGGRVAIVDGAPAPVLVYRRREHWISVTELPLKPGEGPSAPVASAADGYHLLRWRDGERAYATVSDMDSGELAAFVEVFRKAAAQGAAE